MSKDKLDRAALEKVAASFKALGEPSRLMILQELKPGPRSVNALVEAVGLSQANVSKHLKVLHEAGFLRREPQGVQVVYEIADPMVMRLCALVCDRLNDKARAEARVYSL